MTVAVAVLVGALAVALAASAQGPHGVTQPERAGTLRALGEQLYAVNCAACHGDRGKGISSAGGRLNAGAVAGQGPRLAGVGAQAADFYLRTGYMPLLHATDQPERTKPRFSDRDIRALVAYVAGLGPGPAIPTTHPELGDIGEGQELFASHCAGCHQIVGQGGVVTGARVPPLDQATATQIAEAVRIGPYLMPKFSQRQIPDAQLNSIVRYVLATQHPDDRGGWGIGNLGPFPEGMVTWFIAALALIAFCMLIGRRLGS